MCDEDFYIVVIGDEDPQNQIPFAIKEEVFDEEEVKETFENLLTTAVAHGKIFDLDSTDPDKSRIHEKLIKVEVKIENEDVNDFMFEENDEYILGDLDRYFDSTKLKPEILKRKKAKEINSYETNIVETGTKDENYDFVDTDEYFPDEESHDSDHYLSESTNKPQPSRVGKPNKLVYHTEEPQCQEDSHKDREQPRKKMRTVYERKSFVKELREQYPELRDNKELLVNCLVEIMKSLKPPPLPDDCFIVKGISYECVKCGWLSETIPAASRHYQERHGHRYLHCFACGVDFRSKTGLYKHEKRCISPDAVYVLKARAKFVGGKGRSRPFISTLPKIKSKNYQAQTRFYCSECSASFSGKDSLQAHEHLHRGERPFLCPHCPRAYTSQSSLTRHLQKHGNQKYICDHCSKEFKVKAAFIRHMDTHRSEKKFPCSHCPKRYSYKAALVLHVNRDHLKLPLPCACKLCPNRYPRMSVLKEHMKKVHGMNIMTRKMFFKKLPTLTDTQLQQAKVVLKQELDDTTAMLMYDQDGELQDDRTS